MRSPMLRTWMCLVSALSLPAAALAQATPARPGLSGYAVDKSTLVPHGRSPFVVLEPGYQAFFDGGEVQLTVTVLAATKVVDGVTTAIVEERTTKKGGALIEVSRNYFAFSPRDSNVYYFGEDVDTYAKGKLTGHDGSWLAGVNGARMGLAMPGRPTLGARYQQENAPHVAMDRAELVGVGLDITVPAGSYHGCIRAEETTPLEPGVKENKYFCPGVGLVKDAELRLVKVGATRPRS